MSASIMSSLVAGTIVQVLGHKPLDPCLFLCSARLLARRSMFNECKILYRLSSSVCHPSMSPLYPHLCHSSVLVLLLSLSISFQRACKIIPIILIPNTCFHIFISSQNFVTELSPLCNARHDYAVPSFFVSFFISLSSTWVRPKVVTSLCIIMVGNRSVS